MNTILLTRISTRICLLKLKTLLIEYRCMGRNVPHDWINTAKANQRWMQKKGDKFIFPGGCTMFLNGVDDYLDQMQELIPGMKDGTIRTVLYTYTCTHTAYIFAHICI